MELFLCCPPGGKDKYPTWQYWQFLAREPLWLLVWGAGFHRHIINFYQICIEHLWHIKQPLHKKKLQLSARIWVASDLKADWKYLCKEPFFTKGEKYKLIYFLRNVYKEEPFKKWNTDISIAPMIIFTLTQLLAAEEKAKLIPAMPVDFTGMSGLTTLWLFLMMLCWR